MVNEPRKPPGTPATRGRPAAATADGFLDAAVELLGENMVFDVTMEEIAAAAGSTKPTLYKHFASKDELLEAVLERESRRIRAHMVAATRDVGGRNLGDLLPPTMRSFAEYACKN